MNAVIEPGAVPRMLPPLTPANRPYWTGGADGRLHIPRCPACDRWLDPSADTCADCGGAAVVEPVSGRGEVFTFTVNAQAWNPEVEVPYVIALVELREQAGLRVPTNIVGCDPADVHIGMPVRVRFEQQGEVFVPLFEADPDGSST